jgi:hypothetical protein
MVARALQKSCDYCRGGACPHPETIHSNIYARGLLFRRFRILVGEDKRPCPKRSCPLGARLGSRQVHFMVKKRPCPKVHFMVKKRPCPKVHFMVKKRPCPKVHFMVKKLRPYKKIVCGRGAACCALLFPGRLAGVKLEVRLLKCCCERCSPVTSKCA